MSLVFASAFPTIVRALSWTPTCIGSEMDIKWPDYDDSGSYFECIFEYNPMKMYCVRYTVFSFIHQSCVDIEDFVYPPSKDQLPTEKPRQTTPQVLPTPKGQSTTEKVTITTVGTKPQEITSTVKATTKLTTQTTPTPKVTAATTINVKPPTEPPKNGRQTPPTSGTTPGKTTKGITAKPPNTTVTPKQPPIGGKAPPTLDPKKQTPEHINGPLSTPTIV